MILSLEYEVHVQFGPEGQVIHEIVGKTAVAKGDCPLQAVFNVPVQPGFRRKTVQFTTGIYDHTCQFVLVDEQELKPDTDVQQPVIVG